MSKTITIRDINHDAKGSARKAAEMARQQARFHVIQAKRSMGTVAYVDGKKVDGGIEARSNLTVKVPA